MKLTTKQWHRYYPGITDDQCQTFEDLLQSISPYAGDASYGDCIGDLEIIEIDHDISHKYTNTHDNSRAVLLDIRVGDTTHRWAWYSDNSASGDFAHVDNSQSTIQVSDYEEEEDA